MKRAKLKDHGKEAPRREGRSWAHLALQVNGRVTVGKILPQQQGVFILFPGQAVTVIIKIKGLPPVGDIRGHDLTEARLLGHIQRGQKGAPSPVCMHP